MTGKSQEASFEDEAPSFASLACRRCSLSAVDKEREGIKRCKQIATLNSFHIIASAKKEGAVTLRSGKTERLCRISMSLSDTRTHARAHTRTHTHKTYVECRLFKYLGVCVAYKRGLD
jgi:MoaA/NifB/PqqE/SkfB family radical SAM enzyme